MAVRALRDQKGNERLRVLIVDWNVHHGNGTQNAFVDERDVLYFSVHRSDHGTFYPKSGGACEVGEGEGKGFTVNVALNPGEDGHGDACRRCAEPGAGCERAGANRAEQHGGIAVVDDQLGRTEQRL